MTIYLVDIDQTVHTCAAEPGAHPYDIRRTVAHVIPGGPCRTPVTIRSGDTTTQIACGRHAPADQQCGACRTIVTERSITTRTLEAEVAA